MTDTKKDPKPMADSERARIELARALNEARREADMVLTEVEEARLQAQAGNLSGFLQAINDFESRAESVVQVAKRLRKITRQGDVGLS